MFLMRLWTFLFMFKHVELGPGKVDPLHRRVFGETPMSEPTWFCVTKLKAGKNWQTIKTPGYPKKLVMKHSRCTWKLSSPGRTKIRVAFRGISLAAEDPDHCSSNYLEVIDEILGKSQGRVCGRTTKGDIVSQGNRLRMDLQIDLSEKYQRGFSFSYISTKVKSGFYGKRSFNDKVLPPLLPPKPKVPDKKTEKTATQSKKRPDSKGVPVLTADGQLIMTYKGYHPSKRQISSYETDKRDFKRLAGSSGSSGGMSTLVIVGIAVGGAVGLLIIALVLRKLLMNKRRKKNKAGEVVQTNSGLPKINMNHDSVVKAKKNILSPDVLVEKRTISSEARHQMDWKESQSSFSDNESADKESSHLPDYRDIYKYKAYDGHNQDPKSIHTKSDSRIQQHDDMNRMRGHVNEGYTQQPDPHHQVKDSSKRSMGAARTKSRNGESMEATRKIPYRYNSQRSQKWDDSEAIEALNNEKFCNEVGFQTSQHSQHQSNTRVIQIPTRASKAYPPFAGGEANRSKSRRSMPRRQTDSIPMTNFTKFPNERKGGGSATERSQNQNGHHSSHLPKTAGLPHGATMRGEERGSKRPSNKQQWTIKQRNEDPNSKMQGVPMQRKQSSTLPTRAARHNSTAHSENRKSIELDYHRKQRESGRRSRFDPPPSPPTLPRHVVPSRRHSSRSTQKS